MKIQLVFGTTENISNSLYSYKNPAIKISENQIMVFGAKKGSSKYGLYCIICTINLKRIITNNEIYLCSCGYIQPSVSIAILSSNKLCITAYERVESYDDNRMHVIICSINKSTLIKESDTIIKTGITANDWNYSEIIKVSENKVLIMHLMNSKNLYGIICKINEDNSVTTRSKYFN
jgi:hypothetical protein